MGHRVALHDRFDEVNSAHWNQLIRAADPAMDLRLLSVFQRTMSDQCKCWALIVRDENESPLAIAALCLFRIDGTDTTSPTLKKISANIRKIWPGFLRFGVLFCGMPIPSGASHLRIAPAADAAAIVETIHRAMRKIARQHKARMLVVKEFDQPQCEQCSSFAQHKFARGEIPSAHWMEGGFASFDDYCAALQSDYRTQIMRSLRKFRRDSFRVELFSGADVGGAYTDELHVLYEAVWAHAKYKLEKFPAEFFRELARQFPQQCHLTAIYQNDRPLAFSFAWHAESIYYYMYVGLDYQRIAANDLYFNLYYADMDRFFRSGAKRMHIGQTSDEFKARLGSVQQPLYFYTRAVNPILNAGLRAISKWAFPPVAKTPWRDVFKKKPAARANAPKPSAGNTADKGDTSNKTPSEIRSP
jgi:predicted N-acyltransferase